ncbi:PTPS-domain-containing protein [Saitoella complicata NRRL Y-17804]|uniref:PTPS-domain-containing protein n=1 Tax=Saitoella complicata (strain BCRC 22490 / CBS 7301 / JCM 7358 / NBRC 10748 / NRRL Y-17804) TaxID=698492 RepID=UPI000867AEF3|nr:PTPS-domain-containing protein [Saitoella complicata NRRL Y-17804]ODQ51346.1 PTPS-domain-containing protein [Saitoella complicata NRRL Y-17804]
MAEQVQTELGEHMVEGNGQSAPRQEHQSRDTQFIPWSTQSKQAAAEIAEKTAYLSRTETFSAAHRLHSAHLNDEENVALYGKCNNINGHGHNYQVTVTVKGKVSYGTGMIMSMTALKKVMMENVIDYLDHKHLDKDISYFYENKLQTTAENLAIFVWEVMKEVFTQHGYLGSRTQLWEVKVRETDHNEAIYRGE